MHSHEYLTGFRNSDQAKRIADEIARVVVRPWAIMEVCGCQTHSIIRNGIDQILPVEIELIHGPGCPVRVTPLNIIESIERDRVMSFWSVDHGRSRDGE